MCLAKDENCKKCLYSGKNKDSNECTRMTECKKAINECMKMDKTTDDKETKGCLARRSKACAGCMKDKKDMKVLPKCHEEDCKPAKEICMERGKTSKDEVVKCMMENKMCQKCRDDYDKESKCYEEMCSEQEMECDEMMMDEKEGKEKRMQEVNWMKCMRQSEMCAECLDENKDRDCWKKDMCQDKEDECYVKLEENADPEQWQGCFKGKEKCLGCYKGEKKDDDDMEDDKEYDPCMMECKEAHMKCHKDDMEEMDEEMEKKEAECYSKFPKCMKCYDEKMAMCKKVEETIPGCGMHCCGEKGDKDPKCMNPKCQKMGYCCMMMDEDEHEEEPKGACDAVCMDAYKECKEDEKCYEKFPKCYDCHAKEEDKCYMPCKMAYKECMKDDDKEKDEENDECWMKYPKCVECHGEDKGKDDDMEKMKTCMALEKKMPGCNMDCCDPKNES